MRATSLQWGIPSSFHKPFRHHAVVRTDAGVSLLEDEQENFSYKRVSETVEEMPKRTFSEKVGGINLLKEQVKEKISENPGANVAKLLDEIPNTSQRSIERILRQLKEDGSIEYRGSRKTGGYYAVENSGE